MALELNSPPVRVTTAYRGVWYSLTVSLRRSLRDVQSTRKALRSIHKRAR